MRRTFPGTCCLGGARLPQYGKGCPDVTARKQGRRFWRTAGGPQTGRLAGGRYAMQSNQVNWENS